MKMVEWHHQFNGHELEQTLGDGEGQGDLACCSQWGRKELDMTGELNNNRLHAFPQAAEGAGGISSHFCFGTEGPIM